MGSGHFIFRALHVQNAHAHFSLNGGHPMAFPFGLLPGGFHPLDKHFGAALLGVVIAPYGASFDLDFPVGTDVFRGSSASIAACSLLSAKGKYRLARVVERQRALNAAHVAQIQPGKFHKAKAGAELDGGDDSQPVKRKGAQTAWNKCEILAESSTGFAENTDFKQRIGSLVFQAKFGPGIVRANRGRCCRQQQADKQGGEENMFHGFSLAWEGSSYTTIKHKACHYADWTEEAGFLRYCTGQRTKAARRRRSGCQKNWQISAWRAPHAQAPPAPIFKSTETAPSKAHIKKVSSAGICLNSYAGDCRSGDFYPARFAATAEFI